jgi:hypothetical protein
MWGSDSIRGQGRGRAGPALDQIDCNHGVHGSLRRYSAGLALTLAGVAASPREQGSFNIDAELAGHAGPHLLGVHVASEGVQDQGRAHFLVGGWATPTIPCIGSRAAPP